MNIIFVHERSDRAMPTPTRRDTDAHRDLVSRWRDRYGSEQVVAVAEEDGLDREIWYERASRLFSAIDLGHKVEDVPFRGDKREAGDVLDIGNFQIGLVPSQENSIKAQTWYKNPTFVSAAKRYLALCDATDSDLEEQPLNSVFVRGAELVRDRDRDLMLKIVSKAKYAPLTRVKLRRGSNPNEVRTALREANPDLEYTYVALDGSKDAFLWSDHVHMEHEYRVLVVGGVPRTGCGNVPFLDGASSLGHAWDSRMLRSLALSKFVEERPDISERYREFATNLASDTLAREPEMRNYCLDLATSEDGKILVVELNSLSRCGTFATDPTTLVKSAIAELKYQIKRTKERTSSRDEALWLAAF